MLKGFGFNKTSSGVEKYCFNSKECFIKITEEKIFLHTVRFFSIIHFHIYIYIYVYIHCLLRSSGNQRL